MASLLITLTTMGLKLWSGFHVEVLQICFGSLGDARVMPSSLGE